MSQDPQAVLASLTPDQRAAVAQVVAEAHNIGQVKGFQAAETNREQAVEMGRQMALAAVAEMDAATRNRSHVHHEERVAQRAAEMAEAARQMRARGEIKTPEWSGLERGAKLPSADWDGDGC